MDEDSKKLKNFYINNFTQSIYSKKIEISKEMIDILNSIKLEQKDNNLTSYHIKNNINDSEKIFSYLNNEFLYLSKILKVKNFVIKKWWVQKYNKGDWHILHTHGTLKNSLSFVLYLDCSEDSSEIVFFGPGYPLIEYEPISFKPEKGLLIIFPSHLPHAVLPNQDYKRFILSGNMIYG
jgi:hypothetical protein